MAVESAAHRGFFRRQEAEKMPIRYPARVLTASARPIDITDKQEALKMRAVLNQGWQSNAWTYRDTIPEIRFASKFMSHCLSRVRIYPAAYPSQGFGDDPQPLEDVPGIPPQVIASAKNALAALGTGRLAMSQIMGSTGENFFIAGECSLVGTHDPETGTEQFRIASVDELIVKDGDYQLRTMPSTGSAADSNSFYTLTEDDYLARMWTPHPRFSAWADSSLRALAEQCDELLILSRAIRATGRSRLAGAGMLLIPDELSIPNNAAEDNDDPQADPFMGALTEAMSEPIGNEGSALAVVPLVVRGPGDSLAQVKHLDFSRPIDPIMAAQRQELIARIAVGLDLPAEVLNGKADLNHWTAWNIDDNTFRYHIEPAAIAIVDALTVGYLRDAMLADGVDPAWVTRIVLWYDATDLVVNPNRSADALQLHQELAISDAALLRDFGYDPEKDAPSTDELWERMLQHTRTFPDDVVISLLHKYNPQLDIIPTMTEPGISSKGVEVPALVPLAPPIPNQGPPVTPDPSSDGQTPPPALASSAAPPVVAARLSRRLMEIDRDVRTKLQVAANAQVRQILSRAGAKVRSSVVNSKDATMRAQIALRPNYEVPGILGQRTVASLGLTAAGLISTDWGDLKDQYNSWVKAAQLSALAVACKIAGISTDSPKAVAVSANHDIARAAGWTALSASLDTMTGDLLYNPDPNSDGSETDDMDPNTLVPPGLIRSSLSIAGGLAALGVIGNMARDSTDSTPVGQIGTGSDITGLLEGSGSEVQSYEWVHGPAMRPFEPHEDLDGTEFATFDDPILDNPDDFPDVSSYTPGDHSGCSCDFMPLWTIPDNGDVTDQTDDVPEEE